jgi:hypothetical protein
MNGENISGDSIVVCGTPIPDENKNIDIPPRTAGKKVIEEGEITISLEPNNKEIVDKVNKKYGKEDREH